MKTAGTVFQTYRHEVADHFNELDEDNRRLVVRGDIKQWNQMLAETAHNAGVITNEEFAIFQNAGYMGLYGGLDVEGILAAVYQSVFGGDVYLSLEEKVANLLFNEIFHRILNVVNNYEKRTTPMVLSYASPALSINNIFLTCSVNFFLSYNGSTCSLPLFIYSIPSDTFCISFLLISSPSPTFRNRSPKHFFICPAVILVRNS